MTKPTKWMCAQWRLRSAWASGMKKAWVLSYPLSTQRRLWSDWADAQADLSLRWAHTHFAGFIKGRLMSLSLSAVASFTLYMYVPWLVSRTSKQWVQLFRCYVRCLVVFIHFKKIWQCISINLKKKKTQLWVRAQLETHVRQAKFCLRMVRCFFLGICTVIFSPS